MAKRHRWRDSTINDDKLCRDCYMRRRRPMSAIRRGRLSVSDWDYLIGGEWKRLTTVPPCEPIKEHGSSGGGEPGGVWLRSHCPECEAEKDK